MRRICLTLPTNRPCTATIAAVAEEAAYAARHFDTEVHLLILDSCAAPDFEKHAEAVRRIAPDPRIVVHHLDEAHQSDFLRRVIDRAGAVKPDLLLDLMLPAAVSYGACTNRAFLLAAALGCESVHRRDSDSRYQVVDGERVFPVHHELLALGRPAADAAPHVTETALAAERMSREVALVGGSFVGELSVDIGEILRIDPEVYHDMVGLWAPVHWSGEQKRQLVDESFRGAGTDPFTEDHSTLTVVDPMRVDMCNIAFHGVHERVPLPPATDTIGSDYFLIHLVHDAGLPGVLHNRNIVNYYTGERRTESGFPAYQLRFVKFLLSMLYFNFIYEHMALAGASLLDEQGRVRASAVARLARESAGLDRSETSTGWTSSTPPTADWAAATPTSPTCCVSGAHASWTKRAATSRTSPCWWRPGSRWSGRPRSPPWTRRPGSGRDGARDAGVRTAARRAGGDDRGPYRPRPDRDRGPLRHAEA